MLDNATLAPQFDGGTVYQAFLSALSYHRWHSPVSGTIVSTRRIDGSCYAEALEAGFDPAGPNESQGFITQVAARALIFIGRTTRTSDRWPACLSAWRKYPPTKSP